MSAGVQAQNASTGSELDWGLNADIAGYSGTRLLDNESSVLSVVLQPHAKWTHANGGRFRTQARLQELSNPRAHADGRRHEAKLQEAFWSDSGDTWSYSIGRQRVAWGRADGINPTDNVSPRDFTRLTFDDADLRDGRDLAQIDWSNETHRLSALVAAGTDGHRVPLALPPGVTLTPLRRDHQPTVALRWDVSVASTDASVSWLEGTDLWPDLSPDPGGGIAQSQHRQRVLGADMAHTRGAVVWRAEAAFMQTGADAEDPWRKHDQISVVAGPEWGAGEGWTLGVQGVWRHVPQWRSPDRLATQPALQSLAWQQAVLVQQERSTQTGVTWRLAWREEGRGAWAEASGLWLGQTRSGIVRLRAQISGAGALQGWTFSAGVERLFGREHSFFGSLSRNRLATVQARLSF